MNPGALPAPADRWDIAAIVLAAVALAAWVAAPNAALTGWALLAAGLAHAARLARWRGWRAWRDRLVLVLHVAYLFVPVGFLLTALSAFGLAPESAGVHAWAIGAIGGMTIAVMSRAALGHTGRALIASPAAQAVYALVFVRGDRAHLCGARARARLRRAACRRLRLDRRLLRLRHCLLAHLHRTAARGLTTADRSLFY